MCVHGEEKGINKAARPIIWLRGEREGVRRVGRVGDEARRLPALEGFKVIRGDSHHRTQAWMRLSRITPGETLFGKTRIRHRAAPYVTLRGQRRGLARNRFPIGSLQSCCTSDWKRRVIRKRCSPWWNRFIITHICMLEKAQVCRHCACLFSQDFFEEQHSS